MIRFFTWHELIRTNTGFPNVPTDLNVIANLVDLARVLDSLRAEYGKPIIVNSGYRSKEVNAIVGGVPHSHHLLGLAADITSKDFERLKQLVLKHKDRFDQVILYSNFVHVSIGPLMRHEVIYK